MASSSINQLIVLREQSSPLRGPESFGPPMWFTLHNGAANFPISPSREESALMSEFIKALPLMIPCRMCRNHFQTIINNTNLDLATKSRENLFQFFFQAHNIVNKRLNKPIMSLKDAKQMYSYYGNRGAINIKISR